MPAENLDEWKETARKEVKWQMFIDASLGLQEFRGTWGNKHDQQCDQ